LEHVVEVALTKDREARPTARQMLVSLKKVKHRIQASKDMALGFLPDVASGKTPIEACGKAYDVAQPQTADTLKTTSTVSDSVELRRRTFRLVLAAPGMLIVLGIAA
jgi:hypothetical protein